MEEIKIFVKANPLLVRGMWLILGIIVVWIVVSVIRKRFTTRIKDNETRYRSSKITGFTGFLVVLVMAMVIFSDKLGDVTVALGVASAGIAFALQEVIVSVAGWIAITFSNFYKVGDRVELGGRKGDVIDIGVLRTTLMEVGQWVDGDLYNGRIVLVANSFVFKEPVVNYSSDFPFLWDEIKLPISYGCDYQYTREMLNDVANRIVGGYTETALKEWDVMVKKYMIEDATTAPMVSIIANDNWVEFTLRYVTDYKRRRFTKDRLFTEILEAADASNGKVKFASATFHLVEAPEIKISMAQDSSKI